MGCWKSKDVIICDKYADIVEEYVDMARDALRKEYPKITDKQIAQTIKFVTGRLE